MSINIDIVKSNKQEKKYDAIIHRETGRTKTVSFGASGMSDYTKHKDSERKNNFISRHKTREDWSKAGYETAGFWSKQILWNKPTIQESIKYLNNKYKGIKFKLK